MESCGKCDFKKKLRYSTYYRCDKYDEVLTGEPAQKCAKCLGEKPKKATDHYIKVK